MIVLILIGVVTAIFSFGALLISFDKHERWTSVGGIGLGLVLVLLGWLLS